MNTAPAPMREKAPATTGARIRALRRGLALTQNELVDRLQKQGVEVGRSYISILEKSDRMPSGEVVRALADVLGTTADYLLLRSAQTLGTPEWPATPDERDAGALHQRLERLPAPAAARVLAAFHLMLDAMQATEPARAEGISSLDERGQSLLTAFRVALEEGRVTVEQVSAFLAAEEASHPTTPLRSKKRMPRRQNS